MEPVSKTINKDRSTYARIEVVYRGCDTARESDLVAASSASSVYAIMNERLAEMPKEQFWLLCLDGKHKCTATHMVSQGTLTTSLVHPREVFQAAILTASAAIIVVHNHPSGDPEPSPEDIEVTRRLRRVGRLIGIPLLDHVIIGAGRYVSLRERLW